MKEFDKLGKVADDNDKSLTAMVECVAIAMAQFDPELWQIRLRWKMNLTYLRFTRLLVASGIRWMTVTQIWWRG